MTTTWNRRLPSLVAGACKRLAADLRTWAGATFADVPVASCVHYGAFRYGKDDPSPYGNYYRMRTQGSPSAEARQAFVEFLRHYRPRNVAEALGVTLSRPYPLLLYPWLPFQTADFNFARGWVQEAHQSPDLLNYYCEKGIHKSRLEEEFFWLERALTRIQAHGYSPLRRGSYVTVMTFRRTSGLETHLVVDGNHRVAAMSALGYETVRVMRLRKAVIRERNCEQWPGIRNGFYSPDDAMRMFLAFFHGNKKYRTTETPAPILDGAI